MVGFPQTAIQVAGGPIPGTFFGPAPGLTLSDWYIIPSAPRVSSESVIDPLRTTANMSLLFLPFRLSFNRLAYNVNDLPAGPADVNFALYSFDPATKIMDVTGTFSAIGVKSIALDATVTIDAGLYWFGIRRSTDTGAGYGVRAWQAVGLNLIGRPAGRAPGGFPYSGFLDVGSSFPTTFDYRILSNVIGWIIVPVARFYTV